MRILLMLIAGALLTVSCGSGQEPSDTSQGASGTSDATDPTATTSQGPLASGVPTPTKSLPVPQPPPPQGDPANVPPDILDRILADAASRGGVERSAVQVISGQAQTWNDGSLGCPEPGMGYTQVVTEGYQVIVSAGGRMLDYRTSSRGAFKVCGKG